MTRVTACMLFGAVLPAGSGAAAPTAAPPVAIFPSGAQYVLEIAADDAARRTGYMYRERVGPDEGMLFIFDGPGHPAIWMKHCKVALDIIWLDDTFRVVEIAHDSPPCPERGDCPGMVPMRRASYVLEVAGGQTRRQDLRIGDQIRVVPEPAVPP